MRRLAALALLVHVACAAAKIPERAAPPAPKEPQYERILGSFVVHPDAVVYLTPRMTEDRVAPGDAADALADIADRFAATGAPRGEAVARLNRGALLWKEGDGEVAYTQMARALALFAEVGDVEGLAHAYEWLGYAFLKAGAVDRAGEHLAAAYQLFELMGDLDAAQRVAGYGAS